MAAILVANYIISSALMLLLHTMFPLTETIIRLQLGLYYLPALILFLLLALRQYTSGECDPGSLSSHWRDTYLILSGLAALMIASRSAMAFLLPLDVWATPVLRLPLVVFIVLWPLLAIRLSRHRQNLGDKIEQTA